MVAGVACNGEPGGVDLPAPAPVSVIGSVDDPPAPTPRIETSDLWLDLLAQRPSATVGDHDRLVVDLGQPAARKHFALAELGAWDPAHTVEGRGAAYVHGRSVALDLPLDGALAPALHPDKDGHPDLAVAITVLPLAEEQVMTVSWNERTLAHLALRPGWERRTLSLPADLVRPGDNRLRMVFRRASESEGGPRAAAIAKVEVGAHAEITTPPPEREQPAIRVVPADAGTSTLELADGAQLVYYLEPPRRARLELELAGAGGFEVRVSTSDDHRRGRAPTVLTSEAIRPTGDRRSLDLSAWGHIPIRLELRARATRGSDATIKLLGARVVAKRSVPLDRRPRSNRDVIVIAIEGARADAFAVGSRPPLGPLADLLQGSLVFERAYAPSPVAVPSHASWLSSVVPPVHLTVRGTFVADGQTLLPEALARTEHFRVLVTSNTDVSAERGLAQGFDDVATISGGGQETHARALTEAAERRLAGHPGRWMLLLNLSDPQAPYEPPRELLDGATTPAGGPLAHLTHLWVARVRRGKVVPDEAQLAWVKRLYRGELQLVSAATGELVEFLRREKRLESAIVVVVGVHGEEFFEHGGAGHGVTLYEESLRVPLAIHAPELLAPGPIAAPVDLVDLAPTIADLLALPAPQQWQGESLMAIIDDPQPPPRLVVSYLGDGSRAALVGDAKLWLGPGTTERFFDLRRDPGETTDLIADGGVGVRIVRSALAWEMAYESRWHRARWGTGAALRPAFALDLGM